MWLIPCTAAHLLFLENSETHIVTLDLMLYRKTYVIVIFVNLGIYKLRLEEEMFHECQEFVYSRHSGESTISPKVCLIFSIPGS